MPHDWEVICDETNNSPEDIENNMLNVDTTLPAGWFVVPPEAMPPKSDYEGDQPSRGWKIVESLDWASILERSDAMKKALGISPEFLARDVPVETRITMAPKYAKRLAAVKKEVEATMRRLVKNQLKPKAVRGGAVLRCSLKKFRSLRLARVWWKQTLANSQNFSWDSIAADFDESRTFGEGPYPIVLEDSPERTTSF
jgi:hypothetical protein